MPIFVLLHGPAFCTKTKGGHPKVPSRWKRGLCFRVDPKKELKGRAPFMGRNECPALIIVEMISLVNSYEQLICARLLDYFSSKTHWNRSLWGAGTILALREVLEASEAQSQGHLTDKTIKGAVVTAMRLLRDDPGMGTPQERETLTGLLRFDGEPRNDLPSKDWNTKPSKKRSN